MDLCGFRVTGWTVSLNADDGGLWVYVSAWQRNESSVSCNTGDDSASVSGCLACCSQINRQAVGPQGCKVVSWFVCVVDCLLLVMVCA